MNPQRKWAGVLLITILSVTLLAACSTHSSKSYSFQVETGDTVKVTLDTSEGYSLSQSDGHFTVSLDDEAQLEGIFVTKDMYDQYMAAVAASDATIITEDEQGGNAFLFYELEGQSGTETNFIVWLKDSDTGIVIGSLAGQEKARTAFDRLTLTAE